MIPSPLTPAFPTSGWWFLTARQQDTSEALTTPHSQRHSLKWIFSAGLRNVRPQYIKSLWGDTLSQMPDGWRPPALLTVWKTKDKNFPFHILASSLGAQQLGVNNPAMLSAKHVLILPLFSPELTVSKDWRRPQVTSIFCFKELLTPKVEHYWPWYDRSKNCLREERFQVSAQHPVLL